jgi:hypothetical protein
LAHCFSYYLCRANFIGGDGLNNKVPNYKTKKGWQVNPYKLQEACDFLRIKRPVIIKYSKGKWTAGTHRSKIKNGVYYHGITLSHYLLVNEMNETLWHELVHAMQAEKYSADSGNPITDFFSKAYRPARGPHGVAVWRNKYEVEAREIAAAAAPERMLLDMPDKYGFNILGDQGISCIEFGCEAKGTPYEWPEEKREEHYKMHHGVSIDSPKRNRRTKDQIEKDKIERIKKIESGEITVIGYHIDENNMRVQNCRMCGTSFKQERRRGRPRLECNNCKVEL